MADEGEEQETEAVVETKDEPTSKDCEMFFRAAVEENIDQVSWNLEIMLLYSWGSSG